MIPSRPGPGARRPWYLGTANRVFTAAITGVIAASAAYVAITGGDPAYGVQGRVGIAFLAVFMGSVSLMTMLFDPTGGRPRWSSGELEGRPAWKLALGPARTLSATILVLTSLGVGLAWGAAVVVLGGRGGSVAVGVVLGLLAAFLLVVGAQLGQSWLRSPALLISADHLRHAGVGVVVDLAWDDVGVVDHVDRTSRWACVKVTARVGVPSYQCRRRWTLLPTDRVPDPPGVELRHSLLADVAQVVRLLSEMHVGGRATRESLISLGLPEVSGR